MARAEVFKSRTLMKNYLSHFPKCISYHFKASCKLNFLDFENFKYSILHFEIFNSLKSISLAFLKYFTKNVTTFFLLPVYFFLNFRINVHRI